VNKFYEIMYRYGTYPCKWVSVTHTTHVLIPHHAAVASVLILIIIILRR